MPDTNQTFHGKLRKLMDEYLHLVYDCSQEFPKNEMFGVTSQYRRSALSIVLNYVEGYARKRKAILKNFLETSYGSLRESEYLSEFSFHRKYISKNDYDKLQLYEIEIGKMLWGTLSKL